MARQLVGMTPADQRRGRIRSALLVAGPVLLAAPVLPACEPAPEAQPEDDTLWEAPQAELREVVRLGGLEDPPEEESFVGEPPLAVDDEGSAYVLHRDLSRVAVFDEDGDFARWVGGGQGEGPGELTFPGFLGFVGDTLYIQNIMPPWVSRFLPDGTHLDTERLTVEADYRTTAGLQGVSGHLLDGRAWMEPQGFVMSDDDEADPRAPFILGDRRMETQDTLFTWRAGRGRLEGTGFHPVAEAPFRAVAPDGSGVAVVEWTEQEPGELQVRFHAPDGEVAWSWSLEVAPRPLPDALRDSLVAKGREQVAEVRERVIEEEGIPEEQAPEVPSASEVEERAYLPAYKTPVRGVKLGRDGTVWLQLTDGLDPGPWAALDPEGEPLFRVQLPAGATLRSATAESVWGTATGDLDVPYVVRWEVIP